jgi:hypothetical protein
MGCRSRAQQKVQLCGRGLMRGAAREGRRWAHGRRMTDEAGGLAARSSVCRCVPPVTACNAMSRTRMAKAGKLWW